MALLSSEMQRLRYECGYNVLGVGAEPYIQFTAVFDQVVKVYLNAGATTTSSTAVTAASVATPVAITLASATGFAAGDTLVIDVDDRQERVTLESISGAAATVLLTKAHAGTYPVTQEGGEAIVRQLLGEIAKVKLQISKSANKAGLKRARDVEWYPNGNGSTGVVDGLNDLLMHWRDELCSAIGVQNAWRLKGGAASSTVEVY